MFIAGGVTYESANQHWRNMLHKASACLLYGCLMQQGPRVCPLMSTRLCNSPLPDPTHGGGGIGKSVQCVQPDDASRAGRVRPCIAKCLKTCMHR